jgi:hypothetical protein
MGFLNDEEVGALGDFLASEEDFTEEQQPELEAQDNSSEPAEDVNGEAEAGEVEAQGDEELEADDSPAEDDDSTPGHRVPYDRFKQVLDARNAYRHEISQMREQMQELQEQFDARQQAPVAPAKQEHQDEDEAWLQSLIGDDDPASKAYAQQLQTMEDRMYQQEVQMARYELEAEISDAQSAFPGVPREVMLQAVASDPNVSALEVAEGYSAFIAEVEEAALADYISQHGVPQELEQTEEPQAEEVRRPARAGATVESAAQEATRPASVKDASEMLREFMKSSNPFI